MKYIKLLVLNTALFLLTACGESSIEGKFQVSQVIMGYEMPKQIAFISAREVIIGSNMFMVNRWSRMGNTHEAYDKDGNTVLKLKGDGKTYHALNIPAGEVIFNRL